MHLTHTNEPSTWIQATCTLKLACSFYVTTANLLGCLTSKTLPYRKTCIHSSTRIPALALLRAHNGVFRQVPLQDFTDPAQLKMALDPIGVDVWQISPIPSLSLKPNPLVCMISASLLDRHRRKGRQARARIRSGNTKSSTVIPQSGALHRHLFRITTDHFHFQHLSLYHSHSFLCLDQRLLIVFPTQTTELQTQA